MKLQHCRLVVVHYNYTHRTTVKICSKLISKQPPIDEITFVSINSSYYVRNLCDKVSYNKRTAHVCKCVRALVTWLSEIYFENFYKRFHSIREPCRCQHHFKFIYSLSFVWCVCMCVCVFIYSMSMCKSFMFSVRIISMYSINYWNAPHFVHQTKTNHKTIVNHLHRYFKLLYLYKEKHRAQ